MEERGGQEGKLSLHFHYKIPSPETEIRGTTEASLQGILPRGLSTSLGSERDPSSVFRKMLKSRDP